jgi:hypothetical protein
MAPPDPGLVDALREALEPHYDKEKSMFGCRVFWVAGLIAAFVGENRVVLRLPPELATSEVTAKRGHYWAGGVLVERPTNYVIYTPTASKRGHWRGHIDTCVEFVRSLPAPKGKKGKK